MVLQREGPMSSQQKTSSTAKKVVPETEATEAAAHYTTSLSTAGVATSRPLPKESLILDAVAI